MFIYIYKYKFIFILTILKYSCHYIFSASHYIQPSIYSYLVADSTSYY